jgi:hypothetical protein
MDKQTFEVSSYPGISITSLESFNMSFKLNLHASRTVGVTGEASSGLPTCDEVA